MDKTERFMKAEIAVEKGASVLLMPVSCRRQLFEISDGMVMKIDIQFYSEARDALVNHND